MLPTSNTANNESVEVLEGLQSTSWGGQVLLNRSLALPNGGLIESCILYPARENQSPEEAYIIPLDFGKRALKGGGVNRYGQFKSTVIVDAYSTAKHVQQEEGEGESESIWRVIGPDKKVSETFRRGVRTLRMADMLPVNETVTERLKDTRVRNMTITAIVENLTAIGVDATVYEEGMPVVKKRNVILPIGLPADDLNKRGKETEEALATLKGLYTIEQFDTRTGNTTTWMIEIVGVIPTPQPRGTHYTATKNLDGTSAIKKKIVTVIDIGGGDIYAYEVDSSSGTITDAHRLGDGTIAIARALLGLVEERYGIPISEAQAQEALHSRVILKGGDEYDISDLLEELKPRFSNLLTTITISQRMLTTFIVFTGGGVALLHDEIRAKMHSLPGKQVEGKDYLIMPKAIAPIANCIGLFAHGYYKIHQIIRNTVVKYITMSERRRTLLTTIPQLYNQPAREQELRTCQEELAQLQPALDKHAGQYYKLLQQQILLERQQQAAKQPTPGR
jgi:hypothetical protein